MLTHAYILGRNLKGPWMEHNALELPGLSRAGVGKEGVQNPEAKGEPTGSIQGQTVPPGAQLTGNGQE